MQKIKIVADSTCDIDPSLLQGDEIDVLPLTVTVGDKSYLDGEEISVSEVYDIMRTGVVPKTAQIPFGRTYDLFRSHLEDGCDVIYIAFSSGMSGCYSLGVMVAAELREEFPDRKVAVVDSKGGTGATGLIVLQALKMLQDGMTFDDIVAETTFMADHVELVFSVDDMGWLAKGGRISKIAGFVGSKMDIHPILHIVDGRMAVLRIILGKGNVIRTITDEIVRKAGDFRDQLIAISHGDDPVSARLLETSIKKALPGCLTTLSHIGGVVGVHIGLKGIGAYCFNKRSAHYGLA